MIQEILSIGQVGIIIILVTMFPHLLPSRKIQTAQAPEKQTIRHVRPQASVQTLVVDCFGRIFSLNSAVFTNVPIWRSSKMASRRFYGESAGVILSLNNKKKPTQKTFRRFFIPDEKPTVKKWTNAAQSLRLKNSSVCQHTGRNHAAPNFRSHTVQLVVKSAS